MMRRPVLHGVALGLLLALLPVTDFTLVLLALPAVGFFIDSVAAAHLTAPRMAAR